MSTETPDRAIAVDEEGYLIDPNDWSEEFAEELAYQQSQQDNVKLTETHWGLIQYFRDYYAENKVHPTMHKLLLTLGKCHGEHFQDQKKYERFLYQLFPRGPVQELCKLAGLPKPIGDVEE